MNKLFLVTIFFICGIHGIAQCENVSLESITNPGPFDFGVLVEGIDPIRNGPDYNGASIYYPIDAVPPYAGISIVPGYCGVETDIQDWGPFYASHGIVAITLGTNNPCADWPDSRALALLDAIETIKEENTRIDSPLFGKLSEDRFAVSGWSMGGGGAQLAASLDPTLKAVIGLCPWLDLNGFQAEDIIHDVPVLIFTGQNDDIANSEEYGYMHYEGTPETTDKLFFEIINGGHAAANGPSGANGDTGIYALSWLKTYLSESPCYCEFLLAESSAASAFETNIECASSSLIQESIKDFILYPNPSSNVLNLDLDCLGEQRYTIKGIDGVIAKSGVIGCNGVIDIQQLDLGHYLLSIGSHSQYFVKVKHL